MQKVWFGWLSAISQLATRAGEGWGIGQLCLHSVTQSYTIWPRWREQGGGLRCLPLGRPGVALPSSLGLHAALVTVSPLNLPGQLLHVQTIHMSTCCQLIWQEQRGRESMWRCSFIIFIYVVRVFLYGQWSPMVSLASYWSALSFLEKQWQHLKRNWEPQVSLWKGRQ